jgi:exo-beta-1,3-glucanase (GH17 family)
MPAVIRRLPVVVSPSVAMAVVLLLFGAWLAWGWWRDGTPVAVAPATPRPLPCVSYAPSQQAGDSRNGLTIEQLRRDFALLAARTRCVRTYTVSEGFDQVPVVAREFGMQVLLGLWIARDVEHNERELRTGIRVARQHRDVVRAIVVGNEVLLRHEQTPAQLAGLLRRVASATGMPVTYADVWGFWVDHAELAREVSFVTVHILPYWDDDPVGIDEVIPAIDRLYTKLQRRFGERPLFVGETGWPTAGRPRGPAVPGRVEQARFLEGFAALAARRGFDYNVIEAFDQPWKIAHEGTVGGHWGLYDTRARPKVAPNGTVVESPGGRLVGIGALLAGLLAGTVVWRRLQRGRRDTAVVGAAGIAAVTPSARRWWPSLAAGGLCVVAVTTAFRQWQYLVDGNVHALDWVATVLVTTLGWSALIVVSLRALFDPDRATPAAVPRWLELAILACAAYVCLGLVFAGRHRDFPVWLFLPGVLAVAGFALADLRVRAAALRRRHANEEVVLGVWLVIAGVGIPVIERFGNLRALGWGSACVLLGLAVLGPLALQAREHERRGHDADAGPGEAVQHHADRAHAEAPVGEPGRAAP